MTDLPTGTVTFLFTDIEGSTRRWQADPDMVESLRRHDDILRVATRDHRGHWVKHTGDGSLAVFASASEAVAAAVQAQKALAAEDWGAEPLRARMGVHAGEAEERDGDYFGLAVSLAARIMAAAHGGQILASAPVQALASGGEVEFRDLGEHRLSGVAGPRRIFQVTAEGVESEFPPLRVADGARVNLPHPRTSFIGRKGALDQIDSLLDEAPLVTLTGAGGCGKTRLAIEVARRGAERFPGGVFFADLSSLAEPTHIARRIADGVGIHPGGGYVPASTRPPEDHLIGYFQARRCLVVLDNCEHLLDACAELVDRFLDECPDLRVLATSREALGVEGERAWRVPSLSLPDADADSGESESVELLLDRARAVRPEVDVAGHRAALAEIARRLDGMPLALELAAGPMSYLSPIEVADRLDDRFRLLTGGRRRSERQQTLEAAIDWSHDLLDDEERAVFRRLSVFAGGFSLDAAASACAEGIERSLTDVIGSLVNKSLVLADDAGAETRYRLLETIRIYAHRKLADAGETEELNRRHRDWFLDWLESFPIDRRTYSNVVIARMSEELDNLRSALWWSRSEGRPDLLARMVNGMFGIFWLGGHFREGWDWATYASSTDLDLAVRRSLEVMMRTLSTLGLFEAPQQVRAFYSERYPEFEALPEDDPIAAAAAMTKVIFHLGIGFDIDAAARTADDALRRARATGLPLMVAGAAVTQAWVRLTRGEAEQALEVLTEVMSAPGWSDEHDGVLVRMTHATAAHVAGEHDVVIADADVMERFGGRDSPLPSAGWSYTPPFYRALGLAGRGDIEGARSAMREAIERVRSSPQELPLAIADCVVGCAACAYHAGERERASELLATIRQGTGGFWVRTPASFAVYLHYRNRLRDELDRDVRRRCIEKGQATSVDVAVDAELARWNAEMYP